ncbi:B12-binding domain-containing radical SAM protein, partial [Magnetococcales bacterium HHB-1]
TQRLLKENIKVQWDFPSGTRSEILDQEVLERLKQIGANYICYAPESGSPRMLKILKKQVDLDNMTQSFLIAKKLGLVVRVNTIIGFPGETRRDIFKTLLFGLRLILKGGDEIQPYIFMPYPGSQIFTDLIAQNKITLNDHYFFSLNVLNSNFFNLRPLTFNEHVAPWELGLYRLIYTLLAYGLGYLLHPSRIVRTIRNLFSHDSAATVLEHRLKDLLRRKKKT